MVSSNGARAFGSGFSSSRAGTGVYTITFPAGTWSTTPMLVVTPFNSGGGVFTPVVTNLSLGGSGSASFTVSVYGSGGALTDVGFTLVAAAT
jgi:hypothetical protein